MEALRRYVTAASKLHADDTPVPVLAPGQGKTKTGRLWTYVRDDRPAGDTALLPPCGLPTRRIAKANIPRSIWKSFAARCRRMPTRDSISSTKMVASSKPRAGRTCGASSTIWNRRTLRRWRGKRCSGSGRCTGSKNRFAASRRTQRRAVRQAQAEAAARLSATVVRGDVVEALAQVGDDGGDSLCPFALGRADALYRRWTHRDRQQRRRTLVARRGPGPELCSVRDYVQLVDMTMS